MTVSHRGPVHIDRTGGAFAPTAVDLGRRRSDHGANPIATDGSHVAPLQRVTASGALQSAWTKRRYVLALKLLFFLQD